MCSLEPWWEAESVVKELPEAIVFQERGWEGLNLGRNREGDRFKTHSKLIWKCQWGEEEMSSEIWESEGRADFVRMESSFSDKRFWGSNGRKLIAADNGTGAWGNRAGNKDLEIIHPEMVLERTVWKKLHREKTVVRGSWGMVLQSSYVERAENEHKLDNRSKEWGIREP